MNFFSWDNRRILKHATLNMSEIEAGEGGGEKNKRPLESS